MLIQKSNKTITSSLPIELCKKIDDYAGKNNMAKNQVLIGALELFFKEERRKKFVEGIKKYGMDDENVEMAEWGMKEYTEDLKEFEK